jgi:hypothetical protein
VLFRASLIASIVFSAARALAADPEPAPPPPAPTIAPTPAPGIFQWLDPRTWPFIPIPEVGTDPNSGTTVGILPVFLYKDQHGDINKIIAPDVTYNPYLGYGGHARLFSYPSEDTQWYGVLKLKQHIERGVDFSYGSGLTRAGTWSPAGEVLYDRTGTYRFFGVGNHSPLAAQSNYTSEQEMLNGTLGWNLSHEVQLGWTARPRFVEIEPGAITALPFIQTNFPALPGTGSEHEFFNRVYVSFDTRDSLELPTQGSQIVASFGAAERAFLSSMSYTVAALDVRHYEPIGSRVIIAAHAALRYMPQTTNLPFWDLSSLGGDRSVVGEQQPLRGFGDGRFVDRNLSSAGIEARTRVINLNVFATDISGEVAPFIDLGKVFHSAGQSPVSDLHPVGGVGFRAIAKPFIVGYVDVGYGSEGVAVFSGINYPF